MPGIFGYYGKSDKKALSQEMKILLTHRENWFDGNIIYHSYGFHGISDFKSNLEEDYSSINGKSIVIYGKIYSFKKEKIGKDKSKKLLELYQKYDIHFLKYLNGSFLLSIYDNGKVIIANDRIGSKTLFYNLKADEIFYSSEIKGILAEKSIKSLINFKAIAEFFNFSYLLGNKTFFKGIEVLPPANILIFHKDKWRKQRYYNLKSNIEKIQLTHEKKTLNVLLKNFSLIMEKSIKERMEDKKKIGIFLSGGLDSRLIAGFAKKIAVKTGKEVVSFTFGTKGGIQEKIAKKVSRKLNLPNVFYEIPSDFIANYAEEIVYKGDGLIRIRDAHFISHLHEIRSKVDTILVGLFCSELFGENFRENILHISSKRELLNSLFVFYSRDNTFNSTPFSKTFPINLERKVKENFKFTIDEIQMSSYSQIAHYWEIMQRDRRYIIPLSNYLSWYLEPRLPFIDNTVVDFALQLPYPLIVNKRFIQLASINIFPILANIPWEKEKFPVYAKGILLKFFKEKNLFYNRIKKFIEKVSLNHILFRSLDYRAYSYYLRTKSKRFIINTLIKNITSNFLNQEIVGKIIKEHMKIKNNHELLICDLLQLELLNKIFFKGVF